MNEKKILILSLGAGKRSGQIKTVQNVIDQGTTAYQWTTYQTPTDITKETAFVADPLIEEYKPDYVYIIGTMNSAWTTFLLYFMNEFNKNIDDSKNVKYSSQEKEEILSSIWDVERGVMNPSLEEAQEVIQEIYDKNLLEILKDYSVEKVKVMLIPYGKNSKELGYIYNTLFGALEEDLVEENVEYHISFDITHSFRSLPFYNYAVLSYFKQVTKYKITIDNIYYGMFEAKKNGITPIVSLKDVEKTLELTNAVSEFKETGSVKSLLKILNALEEKVTQIIKLIDVLNKFNWAIGSNDGNAVTDCIVDMNTIIHSEEEIYDRYSDIINALKNALESKICSVGGMLDVVKAETPMQYANNQLILSTWYLNQHRYSQAIQIACEAFKSYMVVIYIKSDKNKFKNKLDIVKDDSKRNAAYQYVSRITTSSLFLKNNEIDKKIVEILDTYRNDNAKLDAYRIRNTSAHNLTKNKVLGEDELRMVEKFIKEEINELPSIIENNIDHIVEVLKGIENVIKGEVTFFVTSKLKIDKAVFDFLEKHKNVYVSPLELTTPFLHENTKDNLKTICFEMGKYVERVFNEAEIVKIVYDKDLFYSEWEQTNLNLVLRTIDNVSSIETLNIQKEKDEKGKITSTINTTPVKRVLLNAEQGDFESYVAKIYPEPKKLEEMEVKDKSNSSNYATKKQSVQQNKPKIVIKQPLCLFLSNLSKNEVSSNLKSIQDSNTQFKNIVLESFPKDGRNKLLEFSNLKQYDDFDKYLFEYLDVKYKGKKGLIIILDESMDEYILDYLPSKLYECTNMKEVYKFEGGKLTLIEKK